MLKCLTLFEPEKQSYIGRYVVQNFDMRFKDGILLVTPVPRFFFQFSCNNDMIHSRIKGAKYPVIINSDIVNFAINYELHTAGELNLINLIFVMTPFGKEMLFAKHLGRCPIAPADGR